MSIVKLNWVEFGVDYHLSLQDTDWNVGLDINPVMLDHAWGQSKGRIRGRVQVIDGEVGDVEDTEDDTQEEKGIGKDNEQETKWFHSKLQWNKAKPKLIWSKTAYTYSVVLVLYGANNVDTTPAPGGGSSKKLVRGCSK